MSDPRVSLRPTSPYAVLRGAEGLVYLDSAATTLVHDDVRAAFVAQLERGGSAGRGANPLGLAASEAYEGARRTVARALGVDPTGVVFTASATDGFLLLAYGWALEQVGPGHTLLVSALEHHANLLPWRQVAQQTGAGLRTVPLDTRGDLDLDALDELLGLGPALLAVTEVSNATGATVPLPEVVRRVRTRAPACRILVDGTQAVPHGLPDLGGLGVDAYVFSGHKAHGVLGAGVVWATDELWQQTLPVRWGGGMVEAVHDRDSALADIPWRFEGGTPNHPAAVALAVGLGLCGADDGLVQAATEGLRALAGVTVIGDPRVRTGIVSFTVDGLHPHDVGAALAERGVVVRVGSLCAEPCLRAHGVEAVVRASFGRHNTPADVERLLDAVRSVCP